MVMGAESAQSPLSQRAQAVGERWASQVRTEVHGQNRRAAGGWPGTMSGARVLVTQEVLPSLDLASVRDLTHEDRERAAQVVYRSARDWWLERQEAEAEE